jgi:hypothetical protein
MRQCMTGANWHISLQMDIRTTCIRNEPISTNPSLVSRVVMISTLDIFELFFWFVSRWSWYIQPSVLINICLCLLCSQNAETIDYLVHVTVR